MSNDSQKPEPDRGKTSSKIPKSPAEATETDLWDLDAIAPAKVPEAGKTEAIPPQRIGGLNLRGKRAIDIGGTKPCSSTVNKAARYGSGTSSYGEPETEVPVESTYQPAPAATPPDEEAEPAPEIAEEAAAKPHSESLTKTERIAIISLSAALTLAGILAVIHFSNRVPTRSPLSEETEYPVSGKLIEIKSAETYWRKPITSGDNPDVVRRDTALISVVKLKLQSKPCAIRVFFRDEEGTVIGDGISHDVSGDQELVIAATAGFDDIGMHAAYRTGEKEPWTVQVFEGPSLSADRKDFRKVLETQISTDRR